MFRRSNSVIHRTSKLKLVVISLLLITFFSLATNVSAYVLWGPKWQQGVGYLRFTSYINITPLSQAFFDAKGDWNATPTDVYLVYDTSSPVITGYNYNDVDGRDAYTCCRTMPYFSNVTINMNSNYLLSHSTGYQRGTAGHEWGHALGLDHTSGQVLMSISRNRETIIAPQQDDINGINALYPTGGCCAPAP